eukprot:gnl/Spiro4/6671_TR3443_c0_g1_i1.p1 gnl/Spiro4/6671_TR3443_c0_g1~~gnl/Spiro4/6671_TR3443_c0_g1_i1.p1  ORF type:complete len:373 (+),score=72.56 gnl/Spiro4/6671_TR3443_c0_g1_i1:38-1120(+)
MSSSMLQVVDAPPPSHDWDQAISWANEPDLNPVFEVLKQYGVPAAVLGYQLNPDPENISFDPPTEWRDPQSWWMAGFGMNYKAPLRVASVSKPILGIVYWNTPELLEVHESSLYELWCEHVSELPVPADERVASITITHLLEHKSGFDNAVIGYDPAFHGQPVDEQLPTIVESKQLATDPGSTYKYSNFGYMILCRLAEALTGKSFIDLVRDRLPEGAPIYDADSHTPITADDEPSAGADETHVYYVQAPDRVFDVNIMGGNGRLVSNITTLTWIGTQFWIAGPNAGKSFTEVPPTPNIQWLFNGSMPGTLSALCQYATPGGLVASACCILNVRMPAWHEFIAALNSALLAFLAHKFGRF